MKFYTGVAIDLKLKIRKFWETNSYDSRSYRGKTGRGIFGHPILNRVKTEQSK